MPNVFIPYSKCLKYGHFIQAEAEKIDPKLGVFFHGRKEPVKCDYLVICTGSSYAFPMKVAAPKAEPVQKEMKECAEAIKKAP
eukprot:UN03557